MSYESLFERDYFAKGLAVCEARILTDTIYFRFRDEHFEFPSNECWNLVNVNRSSFDSAPVERVRELHKAHHGNPA